MAESLAGWLAAWDDENYFFDSGLSPIGIRVQPQPFSPGVFTHTSNRWVGFLFRLKAGDSPVSRLGVSVHRA